MQHKYSVVHRIQGQQFSWQEMFRESQEITLTSSIHSTRIESHLQITRLLKVPNSAEDVNLGIQLFTCTKGMFESSENKGLEYLQNFAKQEVINIMWPFAIEKFRNLANNLVTQDMHIEFSFEEKFPLEVIKYKVDSGDIRVREIDGQNFIPTSK